MLFRFGKASSILKKRCLILNLRRVEACLLSFGDAGHRRPASVKRSKYIMKFSLIALTVGAFGIGMTEFVMMGILPDLSTAFDVTIPQAGYLISAYALGVVVGAPVLVGWLGNHPPKRILIGLMVMFTVGNGLSAISPNYGLMMMMRFISGLPHGAFFGVGAVVATRLADPGREARAISVMFAGLTIANILGVPLGTYLGHHFGWRFTFGAVSVVGMLAILSIQQWMPVLTATAGASLKRGLSVFSKREPWLIAGITMIGTGGFFAWFSYIAPLMTQVGGFSDDALTIVLVIAGVGMAAGNFVGGRLADRSPLKATYILLITMAVVLVVLVFAVHYKPTALVMTFITGGAAFALASPLQMLMIRAARGAEMLASAVIQGAFNIGNALGAYLGGLPIAAGLGYTSPEWVGAAMALCGLAIALAAGREQARQQEAAVGA